MPEFLNLHQDETKTWMCLGIMLIIIVQYNKWAMFDILMVCDLIFIALGILISEHISYTNFLDIILSIISAVNMVM